MPASTQPRRLDLCVWTFAVLVSAWIVTGCQSALPPGGNAPGQTAQGISVPARSADDVLVVDCLLPGQIRKLGTMTYLSPRRAVKTTALDCEIRGGEYVAYDRSNLATALSVWLPQAQAGEKVAQTYVGEIYQRGFGHSPPNYRQAAQWFQKAAEQGYHRAQMSLGNLYEQGLGVPRDQIKALAWYRRATGLEANFTMDSSIISPEERQELESLRKVVQEQKAEAEALRTRLEQSRQELEQTQLELKRRSSRLDRERKRVLAAQSALQKRRKDLARTDQKALARLEAELRQRETELQKHRQAIEQLNRRVAAREAETRDYRQKVTRFQERLAKLPPPLIEIFDPKPVETRGVSVRRALVDPGEDKRRIIGRVWAPAGLATFRVNAREEKPAPDGTFKVWIPITGQDSTPIRIRAVDTNGKSGQLEFELTARPPSAASGAGKKELLSFDFGRFYALVIGNNDYRNLPRLSTAVQDARDVAQVLERRYGFEVTLLLNAGRDQILLAMDKFRRQLTEVDNFLLYYAGHGELETKNRRGYWLPIGASTDSTVHWIRTDQITDMLNLMSPLRAAVIADTCYSGIMTRSALTRLESGKSRKLRYNLIKIQARKRARVVLSSGGLKPVLDSGSGDHSVYANALLKVLKGNHDIIKAQEVHDEVTKNVAYASERLGLLQIPQYGGLIRSGHEMGDFIFVPATESKQSQINMPNTTSDAIPALAAASE